MTALGSVLLVGGGRMGGAMLAGWLEQGLPACVVVDPSAGAAGLVGPSVRVVPSADAVPDGFRPDAVVLAVKPQQADAVLPLYRGLAAQAVVLSIMAGRSLDGLRRALGPAALVRAMPNTPAAIRRGYTVACAGPDVSATQRALCDGLLRAVGEIDWVEDEALLDPVTAVSGGGPAYVFLLTELLEAEAARRGIPPALARRMARHTVSGAGALLEASGEDAAALRRAVTSPGGTTEQALAVLMAEDAVPRLVTQAVEAAIRRSRELAG